MVLYGNICVNQNSKLLSAQCSSSRSLSYYTPTNGQFRDATWIPCLKIIIYRKFYILRVLYMCYTQVNFCFSILLRLYIGYCRIFEFPSTKQHTQYATKNEQINGRPTATYNLIQAAGIQFIESYLSKRIP